MFYSSTLNSVERTAIRLNWHEETIERQQYCDFILEKDIVGGCEIHIFEQEGIAYLRWSFINENICGKGMGSESMSALKNDFVKEGITRSYYKFSE